MALAIRLEEDSEPTDPGTARGKRSYAARAPVTPTSASQMRFQLGPQIRKYCPVPIPIPRGQRCTQVSASRRHSISALFGNEEKKPADGVEVACVGDAVSGCPLGQRSNPFYRCGPRGHKPRFSPKAAHTRKCREGTGGLCVFPLHVRAKWSS